MPSCYLITLKITQLEDRHKHNHLFIAQQKQQTIHLCVLIGDVVETEIKSYALCNFTRGISESLPLHSPDKVVERVSAFVDTLCLRFHLLVSSDQELNHRELLSLDSFHQKTPSKAQDSVHHKYICISGHFFFNSF